MFKREGVRTIRAFTLLELLVVIALISVLVTLLAPALSSTLGSARGFRCQMSLRQIAFDFSLFADEQFKMERGNGPTEDLTARIIDLVAPFGKGQRGLIVSPPKAGKTILMQNIAQSIAANYPDVYLIVLLIDERPEEVTDMQRTVRGEVVASTFDEPERLAELVAALSEHYEAQFSEPWQPNYPPSMLSAIVGVEIDVVDMQAKYKLSQNLEITSKTHIKTFFQSTIFI